MITMTSSYFRRYIYRAIKIVQTGETIEVTFGKKKEVLGYFKGPNTIIKK
jgi:hypothetical protein